MLLLVRAVRHPGLHRPGGVRGPLPQHLFRHLRRWRHPAQPADGEAALLGVPGHAGQRRGFTLMISGLIRFLLWSWAKSPLSTPFPGPGSFCISTLKVPFVFSVVFSPLLSLVFSAEKFYVPRNLTLFPFVSLRLAERLLQIAFVPVIGVVLSFVVFLRLIARFRPYQLKTGWQASKQVLPCQQRPKL